MAKPQLEDGHTKIANGIAPGKVSRWGECKTKGISTESPEAPPRASIRITGGLDDLSMAKRVSNLGKW